MYTIQYERKPGVWRMVAENIETLEKAKEQIKSEQKSDENFNTGPFSYRICRLEEVLTYSLPLPLRK